MPLDASMRACFDDPGMFHAMRVNNCSELAQEAHLVGRMYAVVINGVPFIKVERDGPYRLSYNARLLALLSGFTSIRTYMELPSCTDLAVCKYYHKYLAKFNTPMACLNLSGHPYARWHSVFISQSIVGDAQRVSAQGYPNTHYFAVMAHVFSGARSVGIQRRAAMAAIEEAFGG